jgi:hypothetical protein
MTQTDISCTGRDVPSARIKIFHLWRTTSLAFDSHPEPVSLMESPADKTSPEPAAMSKSAMKKAAKAQFFAEGKAERRAKEKERRKANKRTLAEKRAAGELDEDEEAHLARQRKRRRLAKETDRDTFPGRIIVDLGFDDKMSDKVRRMPSRNRSRSLTSSRSGSCIPYVADWLRLRCESTCSKTFCKRPLHWAQRAHSGSDEGTE